MPKFREGQQVICRHWDEKQQEYIDREGVIAKVLLDCEYAVFVLIDEEYVTYKERYIRAK